MHSPWPSKLMLHVVSRASLGQEASDQTPAQRFANSPILPNGRARHLVLVFLLTGGWVRGS
jgi:hypothetical protein